MVQEYIRIYKISSLNSSPTLISQYHLTKVRYSITSMFDVVEPKAPIKMIRMTSSYSSYKKKKSFSMVNSTVGEVFRNENENI